MTITEQAQCLIDQGYAASDAARILKLLRSDNTLPSGHADALVREFKRLWSLI